MCLGFPSYGWYEENDWDLKKKIVPGVRAKDGLRVQKRV